MATRKKVSTVKDLQGLAVYPKYSITEGQAIKVGTRYKNAMRELWSKSTYRSQAMKRANRRIKSPFKHKNGNDKYETRYKCSDCGYTFKAEYVEVDHKKELHRIDWKVPFHENLDQIMLWTESLFCHIDNLQVLCKRCHTIKTMEYNKFLHLGGELL